MRLVWLVWLVAAVFLFVACKGKAPVDETVRLRPALMPKEIRGLVLGVSTEKDVREALADLELSTSKDVSFGGEEHVKLDDRPAIVMRAKGCEVWLTKLREGAPKVTSVTLRRPALCAWGNERIATIPNAAKCRHTNRSSGQLGKGWFYCLRTNDDDPVEVDCMVGASVDELRYRVVHGGD